MKEFFEKLDKEKVFAGIFGLIAIVAIFCEMKLGSFDTPSVAGGIKDIAGTALDVIMLFLALSLFKPRKKIPENFEGYFSVRMKEIEEKYNPLISIDETKKGRCNIADNMTVLYQDIECAYDRLFDFDFKKGEISFFVHKKLFMGRSKEDFTERQKSIIKDIASKIKNDFSEIVEKEHSLINQGFTLKFKEDLLTKDDALKVSQLIDKVILLYIVEYNKK